MGKNYIVNNQFPSLNYNERQINEISSLVLHYTAAPFKSSLNTLTKTGNVSAHYLISDNLIDEEQIVFKLVDEDKRAWHAGLSYWKGNSNINNTSIGIEIVNEGFTTDAGTNKVKWYPYPEEQIEIIIQLSKDIINKYNIHPTCVVGHSDISPGRKSDPGILFPWNQLAKHGVGAWQNNEHVESIAQKIISLPEINIWQQKFRNYGYNIDITNKIDNQTNNVVRAFQFHFRQENVSGKIDIETFAILEALLRKYTLNA